MNDSSKKIQRGRIGNSEWKMLQVTDEVRYG